MEHVDHVADVIGKKILDESKYALLGLINAQCGTKINGMIYSSVFSFFKELAGKRLLMNSLIHVLGVWQKSINKMG